MELYKKQLEYGGKFYKPGVYDISNDEYHASTGLSRSSLCEFKNSPLTFWDKCLNPLKEPKTSSKDMRIGNAVHTLILEPHLFDRDYIVKKKVDGRTKEGKEYNYQFEVESVDRIVIEEDSLALINQMVSATKEHAIVQKILKNSAYEKSIFWIDSQTELLCKARPDIWNGNKIADLKTTDSVNAMDFSYSIKSYNYHIQAAMQIDAVLEATGRLIEYFIIIAIPKSRPFKPYLYRLPDEYIQQGREEYKNLLKIARACFDKNSWDLDRDTIIELPVLSSYSPHSINQLMEIYKCLN